MFNETLIVKKSRAINYVTKGCHAWQSGVEIKKKKNCQMPTKKLSATKQKVHFCNDVSPRVVGLSARYIVANGGIVCHYCLSGTYFEYNTMGGANSDSKNLQTTSQERHNRTTQFWDTNCTRTLCVQIKVSCLPFFGQKWRHVRVMSC